MADVRDDERTEGEAAEQQGRDENAEAQAEAAAAGGGAAAAQATAQAAGHAEEAAAQAEQDPSLTDRLAQAEQEAAKFKDEFLRALAETENVRRRAAREKSDASKYAITGLARDLLPVADNLRRAVDAVDPQARADDPALEALVAGIEMTEKALLGVFERYGIVPIEAEGQRFDPHVHEAMFEIPNESVPHGTVVQVLERGYMIHDRPLRPARVGVSRGGPKPEAGEPSAAAEDAAGTVKPFPRERASAYDSQGEQGADGSGSRYDEKH